MQNKVYEYLFGDEDARFCKDIPESACKEQPRNFFLHIAALTLTKTGDHFIDPKITLSWLLGSLGAPALYLSLLVPVHNTFSLLPQLVVAAAIRRFPVRKWFWSAGSVGQAFALVIMAFVTLNLEGAGAGLGIVLALLLFSLSRGVCSVAQKDVLGKTVSKTRRGRVSGYTEMVAGVFTLGLALWLLAGGERTVQVVAGILLFSAGLWLLAAAVFAQMAEVPGATEGGGNALGAAIAQFGLLASNTEFRKFVITRAALLGSALSAPYLVALVQSASDGGLSTLGSLLLAASLASFFSGGIWGRLADRSSARCMALSGALAGLTGFAAIFLTGLGMESIYPLAACVFTLYLAHAGVRIGRKTHLVDLASADERSAMVAVSNTMIGLLLLVFAALGAWAASFHTYAGLAFFSALALLGALLSMGLREVQQPQAD
ncbi:MAG: MFS transporter [Pseudohongiellaceae bacterium]